MQRILSGLALVGCASMALGQVTSWNTTAPIAGSAIDILNPAGDGCGISKSPDQGAFWNPVGPNGSYVYANSFIPCEDIQVDGLGMWLLDQSGVGGPGIRFEVWGSVGGNVGSGPDAGNILGTTGSLDLAGTPTLEFYQASTTSTFSLDGGTAYWFVATSVGEAGEGSWQVGAHTQNTGGVVDNGTFWYSNDPAGINFDGQALTPEMAFEVSTGGEPTGANYYIDSGVRPWGLGDYDAAMNAVFGNDWVAATYADNADAILKAADFIYLEGSDSSASELTAWLADNGDALEQWVADGGNLYLNAAPNEGGNIDFGFGVTLVYPDFSGEGHAVDAGHPIFNGPFTPVATDYTGNSFGHATISGGGNVLIDNEFGSPVLVEGKNGGGNVVFGGMTAPFWQAPQPDSQNLLQNILVYVSGGGDDGCFADCDGNGQLNILDFVCYQGVFQSGDVDAADCDGNGQLNILDFVCFQGEFQAGCN